MFRKATNFNVIKQKWNKFSQIGYQKEAKQKVNLLHVIKAWVFRITNCRITKNFSLNSLMGTDKFQITEINVAI